MGASFPTFGEGHDPDASQITKALGERWETMNIQVKPYAAMAALHAPLDTLFDLSQHRNLRPEDILHIEVDMADAAFQHSWWHLERPLTSIAAQMNVAYALAVAIIDGTASLHQFSPQRISQDDVWELIPKITAHHDPDFDTGGPTARGSTRIRIFFTDGTHLEGFRSFPKIITHPLANEQIATKFRTLTYTILDPTRQAAIEAPVLQLETLPDLTTLCHLLAPPVNALFD